MDEKNLNVRLFPPKDYLPIIGAVAGCLLVVFLGVMIYSKIVESRYVGQGSQYKNTVAVSGQGKTVAKPDIGQVSLSVISDAGTVADAQKDNTEKINKVTKTLKDLGIKEEDIKTTTYTIYPSYQYTDGRSIIIGYQVNQTLEVKIRDLAKVGDILGKAANAGVNQVGSLSFTFDNPDNLREQARQEAIQKAKDKAEVLAKSLGVSLGKLVSFNETYDGSQPSPIYYAREEMGGGGASPSVQTGQNEIIVTVSLAYEIY